MTKTLTMSALILVLIMSFAVPSKADWFSDFVDMFNGIGDGLGNGGTSNGNGNGNGNITFG